MARAVDKGDGRGQTAPAGGDTDAALAEYVPHEHEEMLKLVLARSAAADRAKKTSEARS